MSTTSSDTLPSSDPERTVELKRPARANLEMVAHSPPGLMIGRATDVGQARERNEDSYVVLEYSARGDATPNDLALLVVADGMGGHESGEVASRLAAQVTAAHVVQDVFLPFLASEEMSGQRRPLQEALVEAVKAANDAVRHAAPTSGTTLTLALVFGARVYLAHVGDSRAYYCDNRGLRRITQDHSVVARLVETGKVTPAEALTYTHRNVLYRAVGQMETVDVDTYMDELPVGACLVLCSDGLWDMVSDVEMTEILSTASTVQAAAERLVAVANAHGGHDNITVLIAARNADG
jgi:PPM family protein phosphatase